MSDGARQQYENLDIRIEKAGEAWRVAASARSGEAKAEADLSPALAELDDFLTIVGQSRRQFRGSPVGRLKAAQDYGSRLFEATFRGGVLDVLERGLTSAAERGIGIRIRLRLADAAELSDIPWEFLFSPRRRGFVALSTHTPVIRYLECPEPIQPLRVTAPLRVGVIVSAPSKWPKLKVETEWDNLWNTLANLRQQGKVEMVRLPPQFESLHRALRGGFHVLHFIGHGAVREDGGVLVFEDKFGNPNEVPAARIGTHLANHKSLRVVVLNACEGARAASASDPFSGTAQTLIRVGIPAVVAMQYEISDDAAISLASEFYQSLAEGDPIDSALTDARLRLDAEQDDGVEWATPVLYMRAPDGQIFDVDPVPGAPVAPAAPVPAEALPPAEAAPPPVREPAVPAPPEPAPEVHAGAALPQAPAAPKPREVRTFDLKPYLFGTRPRLPGTLAVTGFEDSGAEELLSGASGPGANEAAPKARTLPVPGSLPSTPAQTPPGASGSGNASLFEGWEKAVENSPAASGHAPVAGLTPARINELRNAFLKTLPSLSAGVPAGPVPAALAQPAPASLAQPPAAPASAALSAASGPVPARWSAEAFNKLAADLRGDPAPSSRQPGDIAPAPRPAPVVASQAKPAWTSATGTDTFGTWADIAIPPAAGGTPVIQRLRLIPAGAFQMGSPDDEPGRYDDEGPRHTVTIAEPFWMFDTPCPQALWEAVTGDNPSLFKSPGRPVENVSWEDAQHFLSRVNDRIPGLDLALPSEAQWEYACRAGTTDATYAGPIKILGEHNAPILNEIAWYGGNSGEGFELENGWDSSGWPEQQYPHTRAGTHPVKAKDPNQWGLYDMLGNVWEWCEDHWHNTYQGAPTDGASWLGGGTAWRVFRGGCWIDEARDVRAAYRRRNDPSFRAASLGFRCIRGRVG